MKIARIQYWGVAVPPTQTALYRLQPDLSLDEQLQANAGIKWIVEVVGNDGRVGLGESHRGIGREYVEESGRALLGAKPLELNLRALPLPANPAYDLFETALYDLVGKALNRRVCHLLGGPFRQWVGVHYWMGKRTPEESALIALEGQAKGFTGVKIKCGKDAPDQDTLERVQAIAHAVGPNFEMVLDANGGFYQRIDIHALERALRAYNVTMLEDPCHRLEVAAMARLRPEVEIPLAYHALNLGQALEALKREACDFMNVGTGGLAEAVRMADMAAAAGVSCWHGSAMELGIRDAAYLHVCAASPGFSLSSDILHHLWADDLLVEPIEIVDGRARVPTGPGLGVELDQDAVARYSVAEGRLE